MKLLDIFKKFKEELPKDRYNIYIQFENFRLEDVFCDLYIANGEKLKSRVKDKDKVKFDYTYSNNIKDAFKFTVNLEELGRNDYISLDLINLENTYFGKVRITFENSTGVYFSEEINIQDVSVKEAFTVKIHEIRVSNGFERIYLLKMRKFVKSC